MLLLFLEVKGRELLKTIRALIWLAVKRADKITNKITEIHTNLKEKDKFYL